MEIQAALEAVTLDGPLEVVSDSTYVVNCFRDRWWEGWLARGWRNSQKKPVANRDLWEPLIAAYRADPDRIRFRWVKGHSGDPMNDLVDRLAVAAATTQQGRDGDGTPGRPGPAGPSRPTRVTAVRVGVDTGGTFTDVVTATGEGGQARLHARRPGQTGSRRPSPGGRGATSWPTAPRWRPTPCSSAGGGRVALVTTEGSGT